MSERPSVADSPIPMAAPDLTERERRAVASVLESSVLSIGPWVERFEEAVAARTRVSHAAAVSSGTAGLHMCLIAAGVEAGDLVITTPFSFVASANVILYERAVPVFVDIDEETGNIDPARVAQAAEDLAAGGEAARRLLPPSLRDASASGSLKGLLPVHAFGQPADMDPLLETADRHEIAVVEDACEALGAEYRGSPAGALGDAGVFAFYPNKQITTGEGGMIVTRRKEWDPVFRSLRNQGRDVFNSWLEHDRLGYNYRLDEMSAALGAVQMERLDEILEARAAAAALYEARLADSEHVTPPRVVATTTRMSWFVYVVRLDAAVDRDQVVRSLQELGIPSRPYFSPIHLQRFYRDRYGFGPGDFPVTERVGARSLAVPFFGGMTSEQVDRVCTSLETAVREQLS